MDWYFTVIIEGGHFFFEEGSISSKVGSRYRDFLLSEGLLPFGEEERKNDMVALLKEPIFQDMLSDLKARSIKYRESREDLIKAIESYVTHPVVVSTEHDMLERAKVEGCLLECVLKLLARDRFDPLGCMILAQQDRDMNVDQMSSLSQVDFDQDGSEY
jgi:hypothetical protein